MDNLFKYTNTYIFYLYKSLNQSSFTTRFFEAKKKEIFTLDKPGISYNQVMFLLLTPIGEVKLGPYALKQQVIIFDADKTQKMEIIRIAKRRVQFKSNFDIRLQIMFY